MQLITQRGKNLPLAETSLLQDVLSTSDLIATPRGSEGQPGSSLLSVPAKSQRQQLG